MEEFTIQLHLLAIVILVQQSTNVGVLYFAYKNKQKKNMHQYFFSFFLVGNSLLPAKSIYWQTFVLNHSPLCFFDFKNKSWSSENKRKFTFYLSSRDKIQ